MKRVLDFVPADSDVVVSRTLIMVHKAIDDQFPNAQPAPQRFAKTVFGADESTLNQALPPNLTPEGLSARFGEDARSVESRKAAAGSPRILLIRRIFVVMILGLIFALSAYIAMQ